MASVKLEGDMQETGGSANRREAARAVQDGICALHISCVGL